MQTSETSHFDYLIVGGGMTGASAALGIREVDPTGSIALISAESHPPYRRPPLTKKLWDGKPESILWFDLPKDNFQLILDCRVSALDPERRELRDESGRAYTYGQLLLATGGSPRRLPFAPAETLYYRTYADYQTLRGWTRQGARMGVIGGGFIGSEIAAVLANSGEQVAMIFPEERIGSRIYPPGLAEFVTQYFRQKGVALHSGASVEAIQPQGSGFHISGPGVDLSVDRLIVGVGLQPNLQLAQQAGLPLAGPQEGGGILVDENLRAGRDGIFAAGDVASFYSPVLQRRLRVEHADNAKAMGRNAGRNMAFSHITGRNMASQHLGLPPERYDYLPFFYSDMFDLGYEAIGELDSRLEMVEDWREPYRQGVVYYLRGGKVRGVLLWDTWDQVDAARALIAEGREWSADGLKGRLPE